MGRNKEQICNVYQNSLRMTDEAITADEYDINSIYDGIQALFNDDDIEIDTF